MKVCIAEKPSVAKEIASILGANSSRNGYYEGNGYQVTWTFGHFCTLKEPHDYASDWKRWSLHHLPMIPPKFGIKLIDNEGVKKQFKIIEHLVQHATEIINCGDAGQEGELIQRWVLLKAKCNKPVKRLWISSLTEESIKEGFETLYDEKKFDSLYEAGMCRAIGDWLLGMNATRLYTVKYGQSKSILSIGRVQTPTLALIVNRQKEITDFVPTPFWELKTIYRNTTFNMAKGRFLKKEDAIATLEKIKGSEFEITSVATKEGLEHPPRLFDLTSLQVECNKRFAMSAEETLKTIQSLYEKKVTTYPRVDTQFLSEDLYPKIQGILQKMTSYSTLTVPLLSKKIKKDKRVFDNKKVTDHHAIIPTGAYHQALSIDEKKVFDIIARRFIAVFYPACKISTTTVIGETNKIEFKTTGKQVLSPGWRVVYDKQTKNAESDGEANEESETEEGVLPNFIEGEKGTHEPSLSEKSTQPPKLYTEATLLRAMETAGKLVENDVLRDALKENGIGRPSTRAAIIETLFKRKYIRKEKKNLIATQTGIDLINTIQEESLKSAELTGSWENKLRKIEKGEYKASIFIDELKEMLNKIVCNVKQDYKHSVTIESSKPEQKIKDKKKKPANSSLAENKSTANKKEKKESKQVTKAEICPLCNKGKIIKGKTAFGCSEWKNGCTYRKKFE